MDHKEHLIQPGHHDKVSDELGSCMSLAAAVVERRMRIATAVVQRCFNATDPDTVQFVYNELVRTERDAVVES